MSTWAELMDSARGDAEQIVPVAWLTTQKFMTWLSEAQHQLQQRTMAVKKSFTITLDPNSLDGSYPIPDAFDIAKIGNYFAPNSPAPQHFKFQSYDYLQRVIQANLGGVPPPAQPQWPYGFQLPQQSGVVMASVQYNKIWVWPFKNATGSIVIQYNPTLRAWAPSEATIGGEWDGFTLADLATAMSTNSPAQEFWSAEYGIREWAIGQVCKNHPAGLRVWGARYELAMNAFEECVQQIMSRQEDYTTSRKPSYGLSPVL